MTVNTPAMVNVEQLRRALDRVSTEVDANQNYLSKLDSHIGDGDHGFGIANGFRIGCKKAAELPQPTIELVLKTIGMSLIAEVGGVSGTIFGSWFTAMAKVAKECEQIGVAELAEMMGAGLDAVKKRGHADIGDKTMVDALAPAVQVLRQQRHSTPAAAMAEAAAAARVGAEGTTQLVAKHGRAKYFGEKSIGFQDAGATTVSVILQALADSLAESST